MAAENVLSDEELDFEAPDSAPELTKWERKCKFFGLELGYVPSVDEYYINHWHIQWKFPVGVLFVIHSSYFVMLFCHRPYVSFITTGLFMALTASNLLFSISYIAAILVGPGYLPFCYPDHGVHDHLSGLSTTQQQTDYIKRQRLPKRCRYFKSARRVVIRPDHLCAWLASFVGRRNHKLFFLFNFWGVVYISMFCYCSFRCMFDFILTATTTREIINLSIVIFYAILGVSFLFLTGNFLQQNIRQITFNRTQFEIMKEIPPDTFRLSPWYRNWEEVFGPIKKWYLWLLPVQAFPKIADFALASMEVRGRD